MAIAFEPYFSDAGELLGVTVSSFLSLEQALELYPYNPILRSIQYACAVGRPGSELAGSVIKAKGGGMIGEIEINCDSCDAHMGWTTGFLECGVFICDACIALRDKAVSATPIIATANEVAPRTGCSCDKSSQSLLCEYCREANAAQ